MEGGALSETTRVLCILRIVMTSLTCIKWLWGWKRKMVFPSIYVFFIALSLLSAECFRAISLFYNMDPTSMPRYVCMIQGIGIYASLMLSLCYCYFFSLCLYLFIVCGEQKSHFSSRLIWSHMLAFCVTLAGTAVAVLLNAFQPSQFSCGVVDVEDKIFLFYAEVMIALPPSIWTSYKILVLLWKEHTILHDEYVIHIIVRMIVFLCGYSLALVFILLYIPSSVWFDSKFNDGLDFIFACYPTMFGAYFIFSSSTVTRLSNLLFGRSTSYAKLNPYTLHPRTSLVNSLRRSNSEDVEDLEVGFEYDYKLFDDNSSRITPSDDDFNGCISYQSAEGPFQGAGRAIGGSQAAT